VAALVDKLSALREPQSKENIARWQAWAEALAAELVPQGAA
jgi:hypothetical protein